MPFSLSAALTNAAFLCSPLERNTAITTGFSFLYFSEVLSGVEEYALIIQAGPAFVPERPNTLHTCNC